MSHCLSLSTLIALDPYIIMNGHMNAKYMRGLCEDCVSFLNDCEKEKMKS